MNIQQIAKQLVASEKELKEAKFKKALTLKEIGMTIRRRRIEKRMLLSTFAKSIGRSQTFASFLESGNAKITPVTLKKVGEVLK